MNNQSCCPFLIICPGIHDLGLTRDFLKTLKRRKNSHCLSATNTRILIFPTQDYPAYSAIDIVEFLKSNITNIKSPVAFISFSAGVVGAMGAALSWQLLGGKVKALFAIDGWGVPLVENFPIHRLSHDYFTHWSSALLGAGKDSFYADPAVEHLELWQSPDTCQGWRVHCNMIGQPEQRTYTTAADFIISLLQTYLE